MRGRWFGFVLALGLFMLQAPGAEAGVTQLGSEFQINTYTTSDQDTPDPKLRQNVCHAANGDFVVVWESNGDQDGDESGVFGQRFSSSGDPIGTEFQVNSSTEYDQQEPAVCCAPDGRFVVVWESYAGEDDSEGDGDGEGVFGQRFDSAGNPAGTEFQVNTYTTNDQDDATVCCADNGNFTVVWESYEQLGNGNEVFGQRFASGGSPLGSEFQVNTYTTNDQADPAACCDPSGNFVIAWESYEQDGDNGSVIGRRFQSDGSPAGSEFQVNTYTTGRQDDTSICCDGGGNFVVIWENDPDDAGPDAVVGQRFDSSGTPQGTEFVANTNTAGDQEEASICCQPSGQFVVVWEGPGDGDEDGIFGQTFSASGAPMGTEFQANTYTSEAQQDPAVGCGPGGTFVVAWESYTQDGDGEGVFGQRFMLAAASTPAPALGAYGIGVAIAVLAGLGIRSLRRRAR